MSQEEFHDEPDTGVEPLHVDDDYAGVERLDPLDEDALLEGLEDEWEDEEGYEP